MKNRKISENKKERKFFEKNSVLIIFSLVSFIAGLFFIAQGITGNIVLNEDNTKNSMSFIGYALVACSIVLVIYITRKIKE